MGIPIKLNDSNRHTEMVKYDNLIEKSYKEILLYEIKANSHSYNLNKFITEKGNKRYSLGVGLTTIALIASIALIVTNKFLVINKGPTKVQVVNITKLPAIKSVK